MCKFYGRRAGALGICYWFSDVKVQSESNSHDAVNLAVYNAGYEEVSNLTYEPYKKWHATMTS